MGCTNSQLPADHNDIVIEPKHIPNNSNNNTTHITNNNISPVKVEEIVDLTEVNELIQQYMLLLLDIKKLNNEKCGIQKTIDIYQTKLLQLTEEQNNSKYKYNNLLQKVVEKDVEDVNRALTSQQVDKRILINILTARPKWHIALISDSYEKMYDIQLFRQIRENLTTQFGRLTGSKTGLGRLLQLITTDQTERDAKLLKNSINDIDSIFEIILTRTNQQLHAALNEYENKNGKQYLETIKSTISTPLYRFLSETFECRRDETGFPLTINVAENTAMELCTAIQTKNIDACIDILVNLSDLQVASIVREYNKLKNETNGSNRNIDSDIQTYLSGDIKTALRAKCMDKYYFLANRIYLDKESIPRILGSLSRRDCKLLRSTYDANKNILGGKTMSEMLTDEIKKESYLAACLNLISVDLSHFPLGVDRDVGEDEAEVENVGENAYRVSIDSYVSIDMQSIGEKEFMKLNDHPPEKLPPSIPSHPTKVQVESLCEELELLINEAELEIKELVEEIKQLKGFMWTVGKQCAQCEKWTRIYKSYSSSLRQHLDNSTIPDPPSPSHSVSSKVSPKKK